MLEEYFPVIGRGILLGIARGLKGFAKHKKESSKTTFDPWKYIKSIGICIGVGVIVETVLPYVPDSIDTNNFIISAITDYVAPWVGTSVIEDIFK